MIEDLVVLALKDAPSLAMLVIVVLLFMRYMKNRDMLFAEVLKHIGDDCHRVQDRATAAIDRNSEALASSAALNAKAAEGISHAARTIQMASPG